MSGLFTTRSYTRHHLLQYFCLSLLLSVACEPLPPQTSFSPITSAHWEASTNTLHLDGHGRGDGSRVEIVNSDTGEVIATTLITNQHQWKLDLQNPQSVPCTIRAKVNGKSASTQIFNAPTDCNSPRYARSLATTQASALPQQFSAALPQASIILPNKDLRISAGESVFFSGAGTPDNPTDPLTFQWDFDGGSKTTNVQSPGAIRFTKPGVYRVSLNVANSNGGGLSPATRTITVLPASTSILAAPPVANIDSPPAPVNIQLGEQVFFAGSAFDPSGAGTLSFLWNFAGAAPNSTQQSPGFISFNEPGMFNVTLTVYDQQGNRNIEPVSVLINVAATIVENLPPSGVIISPANNMVIFAGDGLDFVGTGVDLDNSGPINFFWDFGGGAPAAVGEAPGFTVFNTPGLYIVTLMAVDALGLPDPSPPIRVITVLDAAVSNNDFPDGIIVEPEMDVTVAMGEAVQFVGGATSPVGNDPLSFSWDFGDPEIPPSAEQIPPPVSYSMPGIYTVTLTAIDALGQADPTPAERIVTVVDPAAPPAQAPEGEIISPPGDVTIEAGMAVDFQGEGDDAAGNHPITYLWNFGDPAIPDSTEQNPGPIIFATPGMFTVTLLTIDSLGNMDPAPPQVVINVILPGSTPPDIPPPDVPPANPPLADPVPPAAADAPDGIILSPAEDITIMIGDTIEIAGAGIDPNGSPLSFSWDIDGGPGNSTAQVPGNATFTMEGMWEVELTVTNAEGIRDPTPASVTVTVLPIDVPPP